MVVFTVGLLPDNAKSRVKDLDTLNSSILELDKNLNPVIESTKTKALTAYKAAEEKAAVIKAVAPVATFVGKFLPIKTTRKLSVWLIKKATQ